MKKNDSIYKTAAYCRKSHDDGDNTESESVSSAEMLEKLAKADLGMLSDEELKNGIKLAAENEDYVLASKLRDELKGRNGGN